MSIEPTSVSKPVMRESDMGSSSSWSLLQGSGTGTTEGKFSSFWDKAVQGAQKLLGKEKSGGEESEEETSESKRSEPRTRSKSEPFASTPGFGNRGLGSLVQSNRRGALSELPFGNTDRSFEPAEGGRELREASDAQARAGRGERSRGADEGAVSEETDQSRASAEDQRLAASDREKAAAAEDEAEAKRSLAAEKKADEEESAVDEEELEGEKSAETTANQALPTFARNTPSNLLNVDQQQSTEAGASNGAEAARIGEPMIAHAQPVKTPLANSEESAAGRATSPTAEAGTADSKVAPLNPLAVAKTQADEKLAAGVATPIAQTTSKSVSQPAPLSPPKEGTPILPADKPTGVMKPLGGSADELRPSVKPGSQGQRLTSIENTLSEKATKADGNLQVADGDKVKAEISNALRRTQTPAAQPAQTATASPNATGAKPTVEGVPVATAQPQKPEAGANANDLKVAQAPQDAAAKAVAAPSRGQTGSSPELAKSAATNSQTVAPQETASTASAQRAVSHLADGQSAAKAAENRVAPVATRSKPSGAPANTVQTVSGVGGGQAVGGLKMDTGNPSQTAGQNAQSESGPKQEAVPLAKATAPIAAKAEKGSGDGQAFSVQSSSDSSTSRSQAAEKAAPTSYSSKSAEEVKETFQALSKGIEKMIAAKQSTFTVRINFDQGGSMSLKVSMENGQVSSRMQTDLPGLEGMIKQNWTELASDWSAKGVKLNVPQFSSEGGESRNENFMTFDQRNGRNSAADTSDGQGGGSNGKRSQGTPDSASDSRGSETTVADDSNETSDSELKTYA